MDVTQSSFLDEDRFRVWRLGSDGRDHGVAEEIRAWKVRCLAGGELPRLTITPCADRLYLVGQAGPVHAQLEERLNNLQAAVMAHERHLEQIVRAIEQIQGSGIVRPH